MQQVNTNRRTSLASLEPYVCARFVGGARGKRGESSSIEQLQVLDLEISRSSIISKLCIHVSALARARRISQFVLTSSIGRGRLQRSCQLHAMRTHLSAVNADTSRNHSGANSIQIDARLGANTLISRQGFSQYRTSTPSGQPSRWCLHPWHWTTEGPCCCHYSPEQWEERRRRGLEWRATVP